MSGLAAGSFDLLETQLITSTTASLTFSSLSSYASTYQHLQIRYSGRTDRSGIGTTADLRMRFNGDTGSNYNAHVLGGNGSVVESSYYSSSTIDYIGIWWIEGSTSPANSYGAGVIDILDAFETTKNKTIRNIAGNSGRVAMTSGAWTNTQAISSIYLAPNTSGSFVSGSRFSLYGLKAA